MQNETAIRKLRERVAEAGAELAKGQQARARIDDKTFNVASNYTFF